MNDQMPTLDVRLDDYFDAELRHAEADFPLLATRFHPARRTRRRMPAIALVGVLVVGLAAGTWALLSEGLGSTGGSGWAGVEALGLSGQPMSLAILDPDEVIDARRPVTNEELAAHQKDSGSARIAIAPLTGDEWLLTWLGTPCDVSGTLTVSSMVLTITMDPRPACGTEPLLRGAVLTFAPSIQPSGLALQLVDPPAALTEAEAIAAAMRQATIAGSLTVGDVAHGSYGSLWQGSINEVPAEGTPPPQVNPDLVVWRIDLSGPNGREQLYIDEFSGQVVDAIWPAPEATDALANGSVVDGIRVGEPIDCPASQPDCETRLTMATEAAIARHGLAPTAIGRAQFYLPYLQPGAAYGGGGGAVVVFDLQDGSQAAVMTFCFDGCFVVDPQPVAPETLAPAADHGPQVDPFVEQPVDCRSDEQPTCNEAVGIAIAEATKRGILTGDTIGDAHYYVTFFPVGSPEATALDAEYLVDIYVAGPHGPTAEAGVAVSCTSGSCKAVSVTDTSP